MGEGAQGLAERLEALARRVPGVAGYLDRERARETDHAVRMEIVRRLERARHAVETLQRRLTEAHDLELLGALGRLTARIDRITGTVRFAARGYRGFFDAWKVDQETLARMIDFDLAVIDRAAALCERAVALVGLTDAAQIHEASAALDGELEAFDAHWADRHALFVPRPGQGET